MAFSADAQNTFWKYAGEGVGYAGSDKETHNKKIAVDGLGNVYSAMNYSSGFTLNGMAYNDASGALIVKLNKNGSFVWAREIEFLNDNIADQHGVISEIECDNDGNVYVLGEFDSIVKTGGVSLTTTSFIDNFLIMYDATGVHKWTKKIGYQNGGEGFEDDINIAASNETGINLIVSYTDVIYVDGITYKPANKDNHVALSSFNFDDGGNLVKHQELIFTEKYLSFGKWRGHLEISDYKWDERINRFHLIVGLYGDNLYEKTNKLFDGRLTHALDISFDKNLVNMQVDTLPVIFANSFCSGIYYKNGDKIFAIRKQWSGSDVSYKGYVFNKSVSPYTNTYIVKVDKDYNPVWVIRESKVDNYIIDIKHGPGDDFYVLSNEADTNKITGKVVVTCYSSDGVPKWNYTVTGTMRTVKGDLLVDNDGNFHLQVTPSDSIMTMPCDEYKRKSAGDVVLIKGGFGDTLFSTYKRCDGQELKVTSTAEGDSYLWNTNETSRDIIVDDNQLYFVKTSKNGCSFYEEIEIEHKDNIDVLIGNDTSICEGEAIQLQAQTEATKYLWNTTDETPSITVSQEGQYSIIVDSLGCKGYDTVYVTTIPYPNPDLGQDTSICFKETNLLLNAGVADEYLWSTGEVTSSIIVTEEGFYSVKLTNEANCSGEDELLINDGCGFNLYTPTAFNPNSPDPNNRVFKPVGSGLVIIKLSIYNRWGEMIYYQEGADAQWDGTYKGTPVMQGRYMYIVTYRAKTDSPTKFDIGTESGYLTLLR